MRTTVDRREQVCQQLSDSRPHNELARFGHPPVAGVLILDSDRGGLCTNARCSGGAFLAAIRFAVVNVTVCFSQDETASGAPEIGADLPILMISWDHSYPPADRCVRWTINIGLFCTRYEKEMQSLFVSCWRIDANEWSFTLWRRQEACASSGRILRKVCAREDGKVISRKRA